MVPVAPPRRRGPDDGGASSFAVHIDLSSGAITLAGRLDGRSAHLLNDAVPAMLHSESARRSWTVHVAELSVADHAGLRAIGRAYRRALRHDRRITLRGAAPALQSALTRVHLVHHVLGDDGPPTAGGPTEP
jgi:anti-anti-sigma regulatory factor